MATDAAPSPVIPPPDALGFDFLAIKARYAEERATGDGSTALYDFSSAE